MSVKQILYILLSFSFFFAKAQKRAFPQAFEIKADTAHYINLPRENWQYIRETKPLTIAQASSERYASQFKKNDSIPRVYNSYWMRYKIRNGFGHPLELTISERVEGHIYIVDGNGKQTVYKTGFSIPWSQRDGLKNVSQIVFTLPANNEFTIYEHVSDNNKVEMHPVIGIKKNVIEKEYVDNDSEKLPIIVASFLFGFFLFAALINFFFFLIIREKVYLMYSITLFFTSISVSGNASYALIFKEHPLLYGYIYVFSVTLSGGLLIITMLMFLQIKQNYPQLYKILLGLNILSVILVIAYFLNDMLVIIKDTYEVLNILLLILPTMLMSGIFIISTLEWYRKKRVARLFMRAVLPFLVLVTIELAVPNYIPAWLVHLFNLSVIWAVIVISWSLFDRFKSVLNENMQQSLEKERILREKEEERNEMIAKQNELLEIQVAERTADLEKSLENLKLTQNQLIQSEKMASLGELTAGIAHEIQNPLNFVNNFSDVSVELLQELKEELQNNDVEEATAIADDVIQNLEKIAHHGRRADNIVKGMLQHSRASSGQKEPSDINTLADEYFRLAYHGLRAKDKSFNADLVTNFADGLPKVNIIPQDMGRVLLNLFTNAFYATHEKSKQPQSQSSGYKPVVEVSTRQVGNTIEIIVKDNGTGIPDAIKDKILQPFFTTKPTGEGTGLGLSLSYDIVVKVHGGSIDIESTEGKFSEFIVKLPFG